MTTTPDADYVGTTDVADHFGVSVKTVISWIKGGKLQAVQPAGENGVYRIPRAEFDRLRGAA